MIPSVVLADVTGSARIVDGDTIWIGKTKIRLHGIDAPEARQECTDASGALYACGDASTEALKALIGSQPVVCKGATYDKYQRLLATCHGGNINLNAEMVRMGWALAYRQYSTEFVNEETEAQTAKSGMWAGGFEAPWEWRKK